MLTFRTFVRCPPSLPPNERTSRAQQLNQSPHNKYRQRNCSILHASQRPAGVVIAHPRFAIARTRARHTHTNTEAFTGTPVRSAHRGTWPNLVKQHRALIVVRRGISVEMSSPAARVITFHGKSRSRVETERGGANEHARAMFAEARRLLWRS